MKAITIETQRERYNKLKNDRRNATQELIRTAYTKAKKRRIGVSERS